MHISSYPTLYVCVSMITRHTDVKSVEWALFLVVFVVRVCLLYRLIHPSHSVCCFLPLSLSLSLCVCLHRTHNSMSRVGQSGGPYVWTHFAFGLINNTHTHTSSFFYSSALNAIASVFHDTDVFHVANGSVRTIWTMNVCFFLMFRVGIVASGVTEDEPNAD